MSALADHVEPTDVDVLVAFFDLTQFARFARTQTSREIFAAFADFYELAGDVVEASGGTVVKFIGDAGLLAWPADRVDAGVRALQQLRNEGDAWWRSRDAACRVIVKAHFGSVTCGAIGTQASKRFDLFGDVVNTAALLRSDGLALTPQVFRKLDPETRRLFKKHTPPITYIPVDQAHRD
jgi:class 3 adenylate cyclase